MKKIFLTIGIGLQFALLQAQVPQAFNYQAVARDANGLCLSNQNIDIRIGIRDSSATGTLVYQERHDNLMTNNQGLFSLSIGMGVPQASSAFNTLNWSISQRWLEVEMDAGSGFVMVGSQQLMSVPYAMHSLNSASWTINEDLTYTNKWVSIETDSMVAPLYIHQGPSGDASVKMRNGFGTSKVLHIIENQGSSNHYGLFVGEDDYSRGVLVTKSSRVGIGTIDPKRALHVNDILRLQPRTSAPTSPEAGDIYFDNTLNKLRVYDGSSWQNCW